MTSRTATTAAVLLSLAAAGAPAAAARPDFAPTARQAPPSVYSPPDKSMLSTSVTAGGDVLAPAAAPPVVGAQTVRAQASNSGFDWGDAGIGAAGVVLSVVGVGGAFAVSQRRSRRTTAVPS